MADELNDYGSNANIQDTNTYTSVNSINEYDFMDYSESGTGGYRDGTFLVNHKREMFYKSRKDQCFYQNYVRPILRAMVEPIFNKVAPRKVLDSKTEKVNTISLFNDFILDCNNANMSLQDYTKQVIKTARLHGITFTVVENFEDDLLQSAQTIEQARAERLFPYVYQRTIQQVKNYEIDKFGNLLNITFVEDKIKTSDNKEVQSYRLWDKTKTVLYIVEEDSKGVTHKTILNEYYHNLNRLPVIVSAVTSINGKEKIYINPPLYDIAKLNHTMFNKDSEIREIERAQGFSILYLQGTPGTLTTSQNNALFMPMDATMAPGFISPNPSIQDQLMKYQDNIREAIFRIAEQNGVTGVKAQASGVSKQWDFFAHESILGYTSSMATSLEKQISEIFKLYTQDEFDYMVLYPTKFAPNNITEEIKNYEAYLSLGMPPKAEALAREKITRILFHDENQKILDNVIAEIREMQTDTLE